MKHRLLVLCLFVVSFFLSSVPPATHARMIEPAPSAAVSSSPLVRTINTSVTSRLTDPAMAVSETTDKVHVVYRRVNQGLLSYVYREFDQLDYMTDPAPEIILGEEILPAHPQPYQYARISTDPLGGVHVIWVHQERLMYRFCATDCAQEYQWGEVQDLTHYVTATGCSLYHPNLVTWVRNGTIREVAIVVEVSPSFNAIRLVRGTDGGQWNGYAVAAGDDNDTMVRTPSIAYDLTNDALHLIWHQRGVANGLWYRATPASVVDLSPPILIDSNSAGVAELAPSTGSTADPTAIFVNSYPIVAAKGVVHLAWPRTNGAGQDIWYASCQQGFCTNGTEPALNLSAELGYPMAHDVRLSATRRGDPIIAWVETSTGAPQIQIARSYKGAWGEPAVYHTEPSPKLANLEFVADRYGTFHLSWSGVGMTTAVDYYTQRMLDPVVIIPGMVGSSLIEDGNGESKVWPPGGIELATDQFKEMTLDPAYNPAPYYAGDIIRRAWVFIPFYSGLINSFIDVGYNEYDSINKPEHRTTIGCDIVNQRHDRPSLFNFAYDWRHSNLDAVQQLRDYIGCIRRFYPNNKINLVGHSLGTMIGRRYILTYPNDHHIDTFVALAAPWLGAPKAVSAYEGQFFEGISAGVQKFVVQSFPSAAELAPSRRYYTVIGGNTELWPLAEDGVDLNGDRFFRGSLNYTDYATSMTRMYPKARFAPYLSAMHDFPGQNTINTITTDARMHHIYTLIDDSTTIYRTVYKNFVGCSRPMAQNRTCELSNINKLLFSAGDGTVPEFSLSAQGSGFDFNPSGPINEVISIAHSQSDHVEMPRDPEVQDCMYVLLIHASCAEWRNRSVAGLEAPAFSQPAASASIATRYLTIVGTQSISVTTGLTATTGLDLVRGVQQGEPNGLTLYPLGEMAGGVIVPRTEAVTVTLTALDSRPVFFEVLTGASNTEVDTAVRYLDMSLPAGSIAQLVLAPDGMGALQVDSDRNGSFEQTIPPTVSLTGAAAADVTSPQITATRTVVNPTTVQIALQGVDDESGVQEIMYSLDGTHFQPYTGTLTLNTQTTPEVAVFATDQASNRSGLEPIATSHLALAADQTIDEGAGTIALPVTLDTLHSHPISVTYAVAGAEDGVDYAPLSGTLQFAPGQQQRLISLAVHNDLLDEDAEAITLTLSYPTGAGFTRRQQVLTLQDNDSPPQIQFHRSVFTADEPAGVATATIQLSAPSGKPVQVQYATSDGTATAAEDYTARTGAVTVPPGMLSASITIPLTLNDTHWEPTERFGLQLSAPANATLGAQASTSIDITNDKLAVRLTSDEVQESAGTVAIPVQLSSPRPVTVTVNYALYSSQATAGQDYSDVSGVLTFPPGTTTQTFGLPILEDGLREEYEGINIWLMQPTNARIAGQSLGYLFIRPNDRLGLDRTVEWVSESTMQGGATELVVNAELNAPSAQTVTVHYATVSGTAQAGSDFVATSGTLVFPPFTLSQRIAIPIINDSIQEADETFSVQLSAPQGAELTTALATATISANDVPPPPTALLVVGTTPLNAGDTAVSNRLMGLGFTVQVKRANLTVSGDATGKALVLISSSVNPTDVGTKFRTSAVPVITWEHALYDDMNLTSTASGDFGASSTTTSVNITNPAHPLAAGLSGVVTAHTTVQALAYGTPSSQAVKVAPMGTSSTRSVLFGYDTGASMVGLTAPARRVGFFFNDASPTKTTTNGWKLFDAAVRWGANIP